LGLLVASLLLLSILTCRVTGLPVSEDRRQFPLEATSEAPD
jgi:hypothetical protein